MIHEILPVGMLQCNCSIFGDETTRDALVIDPGDEIGEILAVLARHNLTVKAIIITHAHIDHTGYTPRLVHLGYRGPFFANAATNELCQLLLPDSAHLQGATVTVAAKEAR